MKLGRDRWIVTPGQPVVESKLAEALHISLIAARILAQRGHGTNEEAERFLHPRLKDLSDPFLLGPLRQVVERIWRAIDRHERITIYGDYDVDGVTSVALLVRVLRTFSADVRCFLPRRMDEGYGLSADGIERCLEETQPQLLIAVDCGTTSCDEIALLKRKGIDVIVLDHHQPPADLPDCLLINPKLVDQPATQNFATVGVVFKVCHGFLKLGRERGHAAAQAFDLRPHLDLVAIGTVADVVPLDGENRIFVRAGLDQLATTSKIGLRALKQVARVSSSPTPYAIGFQLGPRLNAMGRLDDALASLELLVTDEAPRADELARSLDQCNRERQEIEQRTMNEALEMLGAFDPARHAIVLAKNGWHLGVIGIVAARIVREFHRPTVVIGFDGNGMGKGSCRSIEGFHIVEGLKRCDSLLERYGGHQAAAGLSIQAGRIQAFQEQFEIAAQEMIPDHHLRPVVRACAEVALGDLGPALMDELNLLSPFGAGNPTPVFVARHLRLRAKPQIVGQGHLKLWLAENDRTFDAIGFGFGAWEPRGEWVDAAFTLQWNEYQGERAIQLKLVDVRDA